MLGAKIQISYEIHFLKNVKKPHDFFIFWNTVFYRGNTGKNEAMIYVHLSAFILCPTRLIFSSFFTS